jgi:hypothetical protein
VPTHRYRRGFHIRGDKAPNPLIHRLPFAGKDFYDAIEPTLIEPFEGLSLAFPAFDVLEIEATFIYPSPDAVHGAVDAEQLSRHQSDWRALMRDLIHCRTQ